MRPDWHQLIGTPTLTTCEQVHLPVGMTFLTGPVNLTSNQLLRVDGTMLASTDKHDYPLVQPIMGYGWGDDEVRLWPCHAELPRTCTEPPFKRMHVAFTRDSREQRLTDVNTRRAHTCVRTRTASRQAQRRTRLWWARGGTRR
jgi:hypothetical protein